MSLAPGAESRPVLAAKVPASRVRQEQRGAGVCGGWKRPEGVQGNKAGIGTTGEGAVAIERVRRADGPSRWVGGGRWASSLGRCSVPPPLACSGPQERPTPNDATRLGERAASPGRTNRPEAAALSNNAGTGWPTGRGLRR